MASIYVHKSLIKYYTDWFVWNTSFLRNTDFCRHNIM